MLFTLLSHFFEKSKERIVHDTGKLYGIKISSHKRSVGAQPRSSRVPLSVAPRPGSPCLWPLVHGPSSGAAVPLRWRYRAAATESAQCTSRSCLFPALDGECSVERGHVTPSRCATPAPCREATRRQNPTGPRRAWLWASGEPQKLPDCHSLLLHSSGEPGDRDPEEAAVWGGRPVGKEIGEGTLREPREHSAT